MSQIFSMSFVHVIVANMLRPVETYDDTDYFLKQLDLYEEHFEIYLKYVAMRQ